MGKYEDAVALWESYKIESVSDLDLRLDHFRILFAYNSGKIENPSITWHDTREIFENGRVTGYTGDTRALFELENQKLCYGFLKPKIIAREPLGLELVKETHAILTGGTYDERRYIEKGERPGAFKKNDYVTGLHEVGSLPEEVEPDMLELLDVLAREQAKDPLKLAAFFHLHFEHIHPFADGNGRVGRTLMNYCLMCKNHPPIIIYEEDKGRYYDCLQRYDEAEELEPMYLFLKEQTEKTWEKTLERNRRRNT